MNIDHLTLEPWVCGATLAALLLALLVVMLLPVWLYFRGCLRASPVPRILEKVLEHEAREKPKEFPKPTQKCRICKVTDWKLSPDESLWICGHCGAAIDGPRPKIRA